MHTTPLRSFHVDHGAKLVDFAGWEMPLYYTGIKDEHTQVRTRGGLFDVSHMGRVKISGRHARRLLERVCTRRISDMQQGQCRYTLMCNEQGGVKDDVIVMRLDDDEFIAVVNASNREKILAHLSQQQSAGSLTCKIDDQTAKTAMVALQGPAVMDMIGKVSKEIPALKRYRFVVKNLLVLKLYVARTGYTGEDGVEVILPAGSVGMALKLLLKDIDLADPEGLVRPAGLGARDTLRLEAGMPLYGHELGEDISAASAGLGFAISMDKPDDDRGEPFVGYEALRSAADTPPARTLVGLKVEGKRTPRQGHAVMARGKPVGIVTSGAASPTLGYPIAMAYVDSADAQTDTNLQIDIGSSTLEATVCKLPFYKAPKKQPAQPASAV